MSPFEHQVTSEDYKQLIQSSVASNYNMVRVWASGNYYADELYDAADERTSLSPQNSNNT